jgi:hypothetical protein
MGRAWRCSLCCRERGRLHPAAKLAIFILAIVGLSMLHPTTNSLVARAAEAALHLAILAPQFWVARLPVEVVQLRRVMLILIPHGQLRGGYYPGYISRVPSAESVFGGHRIRSRLRREHAIPQCWRRGGFARWDWQRSWRAAASGFYAVLISLGVFVRERAWWFRLATLLAIGASFTSEYLSEVRSMLVMLAVCTIALTVVLLWTGERARVPTLSSALAIVGPISYTSAVTVGSSQPALRGWAVVVLAYNIGALIVTFDYAFSQSQGTMELWMLNAALFSSCNHVRVGVFVHQ